MSTLNPIPETESHIQQEICIWYRNNYCLKHHNPRCLIFSIPNEGDPRKFQTGALPGVSDLYIQHLTQVTQVQLLTSHISMRILWVECKTLIGKQSAKQKDFQAYVEQLGFPNEYHIVRSKEEFTEIIRSS